MVRLGVVRAVCVLLHEAAAQRMKRYAHELYEMRPAYASRRQLPLCPGSDARANLSTARYRRLDCAESENRRGEVSRAQIRADHDGREDHEGLALLPGTDFQDGVIEADIALKTTVPPGVRHPGFVGIAFRARPDASHYELFYLRPGNSDAPDQAMRNHSVQYVCEPGFGWYQLRREWPSVYESHAQLAKETWTRVRIEVAGRSAKLYVNGSTKPSLVVDGMKGEDLHGAVGLWSFTG